MRGECVNDTDGDGNCAACARNPEAPCRPVFHGDLLVTAVRLAASNDWRTISVRRLLRIMGGERRALPEGRRR